MRQLDDDEFECSECYIFYNPVPDQDCSGLDEIVVGRIGSVIMMGQVV